MSALRCDSCGKEMSRGGLKYVVEIRSFADFDGYLEEYPGDVEEGIADLIDAMDGADSKGLEDDVYQEIVYILCKECRDKFASDPFQSGRLSFEEEEVKGTVH
ncbi:MAG: hypothetical protein V3W31_06595 [Thermodesulfobacteriota bacterium]